MAGGSTSRRRSGGADGPGRGDHGAEREEALQEQLVSEQSGGVVGAGGALQEQLVPEQSGGVVGGGGARVDSAVPPLLSRSRTLPAPAAGRRCRRDPRAALPHAARNLPLRPRRLQRRAWRLHEPSPPRSHGRSAGGGRPRTTVGWPRGWPRRRP